MPRTRLTSTYNLFGFIMTASDLVSEVLSHISSNEDSVGLDRIELQEGRMEDVCETLFLINQRLNDIYPLSPEISQFKDDMNDLSRYLNVLRNYLEVRIDEERQRLQMQPGLNGNVVTCSVRSTGHKGRPQYVISIEQLEFLRGLYFSWTKIANIVGISTKTLERRRQALGIMNELGWSEISDDNLKQVMVEVQRLTPGIGQTRMQGALRSRGLRVQRQRVRNCLKDLDPVGTALRWRQLIQRRKYHVRFPNSLWHIDGTIR